MSTDQTLRVEHHLLGMTREDFRRLIPKVLGPKVLGPKVLGPKVLGPKVLETSGEQSEAQCWQTENGDRRLKIVLGSQGERRLSALLSLPTLETTFTFAGYTESEYSAFMERFWLVFRRGGG